MKQVLLQSLKRRSRCGHHPQLRSLAKYLISSLAAVARARQPEVSRWWLAKKHHRRKQVRFTTSLNSQPFLDLLTSAKVWNSCRPCTTTISIWLNVIHLIRTRSANGSVNERDGTNEATLPDYALPETSVSRTCQREATAVASTIQNISSRQLVTQW